MKQAKKLLAILLAMVMLLSLTACGGGDSSTNKEGEENTAKTTGNTNNLDNGDESNTDKIEHTGKKIEGTLCGASVFSEGLAFVAVDKQKTYCINKEGYIVFELDMRLYGFNGEIDETFHNGVAILADGAYLCDKTGELISTEDLGVTTFYDDALAGGYILADKVTASYDSAKKEVGVLNTSLEWVVEPSEELYDQIGEYLDAAIDTPNYYHNDYLCVKESRAYTAAIVVGYLNLKTGELVTEAPFEIPSHGWDVYLDHTYRVDEDTIAVDMSKHANVSRITSFDKGLACVQFHNADANANFFTVINEKGEFLLEPVNYNKAKNITNMFYDGKDTVLLTSGTELAMCYSLNGELLGEKQRTINDGLYVFRYSEDVVVFAETSAARTEVRFLNPDFTPLW